MKKIKYEKLNMKTREGKLKYKTKRLSLSCDKCLHK